MGKRNLKDKISDVVFWTAVFIILYFLVAYLLESNWLEETLKLGKVYSLLKDALGLAAAFLAPVAALLIFNDWREQHVAISNEENSQDIYKKIHSISRYFHLPVDNNSENFYKNQSEFYKLLNEINHNGVFLKPYDCKSQEYILHLNELEKVLFEYWEAYAQHRSYYYLSLNEREVRGTVDNKALDEYTSETARYLKLKLKYNKQFYELKNKLGILHAE